MYRVYLLSLLHVKNYQDVLALSEHVMNYDANDVSVLSYRADALLSLNRPKEALTNLNRVLDIITAVESSSVSQLLDKTQRKRTRQGQEKEDASSQGQHFILENHTILADDMNGGLFDPIYRRELKVWHLCQPLNSV